MADRSGIEWTDATWNPVTGCTEVSPGCDHCYAKTFAERWRGTPGHPYERGFDLTLRPERMDQPVRWKRPRRIFVNSMSDLFHEGVPNSFIVQVFATMALAQQHTFQVLTKRHGRMRSLLSNDGFRSLVAVEVARGDDEVFQRQLVAWPLPNVWLGVSVEDQKSADIRIPALLDTQAAVRWISAEPLLGPVDLDWPTADYIGGRRSVDWVVVGGESGPGARPMHPEWARLLREQCRAARVPFLFKQRGEWTDRKSVV